ncbi:MAG: hypothetical protein ACF8XB_19280 [Planctomycetota bacterium JB042]
MSRTILKRLSLVGLGLALGLGVAELLVRAFGLGEKGSVGALYEPDPRLGWRHRSGVEFDHRTDEFAITWRLNDEGLRRDTAVEVGPDRGRWIVLGDSHTAGHGVEGEETFSARLESLAAPVAPRLEVLNLGVDGYSTAQACLALEPALDRYAPSAVILGVYPANDLRENLSPFGLGGFPRPRLDASLRPEPAPATRGGGGAEPDGALARMKETLSSSSKLYAFAGDRIRGGPLHRLLARAGLMRPPPDDRQARVVRHCRGCHGQLLWGTAPFSGRPRASEQAVERAASIVERMAATCRDRDVRFVAVLIPSRLEVEGDAEAVDAAAEWMGAREKPLATIARLREAVAAALADRRVSVLDLLPAARRVRDAAGAPLLYHPDDWHLSPAGHALVADELFLHACERGWVGP